MNVIHFNTLTFFLIDDEDNNIIAPVPPLLPNINMVRDSTYCVVCTSAESTHACIPCGHKVLCVNCTTDEITKCPICQLDILMIIRIH